MVDNDRAAREQAYHTALASAVAPPRTALMQGSPPAVRDDDRSPLTPLVVQMTPTDGLVEIHPWTDTIFTGTPPDQIVHSRSILDVWSEAELNAVGIYHIDQIEPPEGYLSTGYHFEMRDGAIVQVLHLEPIPPPPLVPLSRRQFFQIGAMTGLITHEEALAAVQHGTIPAKIQSYIDAIPDEGQKFAVQMLLAGAGEFDRYHPMTEGLGAYLGVSSEQLDQMWRQGALL